MLKHTGLSLHTFKGKATAVFSTGTARRLIIVFVAMTLFVGCNVFSQPSSRMAVCGMTDQGVVLLMADVETGKDAITVGKLEPISLPAGANCPYQWSPIEKTSTASSKVNEDYGWFVAGASKGGLGGTVFRLNWQDARPEKWFQLPEGDLILDIGRTKTKGWEAVITGGDPKCGEMPSWESASIKCAQKRGVLYLADNDGRYSQILAPDSIGRCEAALDPTGTMVAFRESAQCFLANREQVDSRIVIVDLASRQLWTVPGDEYRHTPVWSPDGQWLAFVAQDAEWKTAQVQIANIQSHQVLTVSQSYVGFVIARTFVWSLDGRRLAWFRTIWPVGEGRLDTLEVFDMADNKTVEITSADGDNDKWQGVDWSPDGKIVEWGISKHESGLEFGFRDWSNGEGRDLVVGESYDRTWLRQSHDGNTLGLVRNTGSQSFLDLVAWSNFSVTTTVELPTGIKWSDLYWISK